ncbi:hypothetical protein [Streptomyces sp. AN091965]|uniref:hypothetical protein n=1 Tax=Streptomyces sp. AN091965 TaxID=2927803 RepID=UPI001F622AD1|nr:hypothetical protein [Streptomyces sp. AN091965]MCI3929176.1 hypothetical protein [Streptomyces sp. AN091965]
MDAPTRTAHCSAGDAWLAAEAFLIVALNSLQRTPASHRASLLADASVQCAWWLVPADAAAHLVDVRQVAVHPPGWALRTPSASYPIGDRFWRELPDGTGRLTEADRLGAALGPGGPRLPAEAFG